MNRFVNLSLLTLNGFIFHLLWTLFVPYLQHKYTLNSTTFIQNALQYAFMPGYLLGSIPFGIVITRLLGLGNLRHIGSGNIGATNVLRTGSKAAAGLTFLCDALKGTLAIYAMRFLPTAEQHPLFPYIAGMAALYGHMFPLWLRFRGGKGIATTAGTMLILNWQVGLVAIGTWLVVAVITRLSSLAALLALIAAPIMAYYGVHDQLLVGWLGFVAPFIVYKHRDNIVRLLAKKESRIA